MINNLKDYEILDYLMTSEFNEGLTPDEFKFLLIQFRYFYRILNGKAENIKIQLEYKNSELVTEKILNEEKVNKLLCEKANLENILDTLKNKKLTFKERITGKLNIKNYGT